MLGLGLEPKELGFLQVAVRAIIVFLAALVMVRLANRRFLAKMSAFDVILGFILASMLARAVNGSAPFFPTLVGGFVLVALHRILAVLAFYSGFIGMLVKGEPHVLVRDGKPDRRALRAHHISDADLLEEARLHGKVGDIASIRQAMIERNGKVSVIPAKDGKG